MELTGQGGIGDLLGDGTPRYVLSNAGAASLNLFNSDKGTAHLPQTYEQAWDVSTGANLPTFPRAQDGFPFFDSPLIANLSDSPQQAVIEGNDSGWIHAYEPSGGEAPGFPKFTGQWPSFSGVIAGAGPRGRSGSRSALARDRCSSGRWAAPQSATPGRTTTTTSTTAASSAAGEFEEFRPRSTRPLRRATARLRRSRLND